MHIMGLNAEAISASVMESVAIKALCMHLGRQRVGGRGGGKSPHKLLLPLFRSSGRKVCHIQHVHYNNSASKLDWSGVFFFYHSQ